MRFAFLFLFLALGVGSSVRADIGPNGFMEQVRAYWAKNARCTRWLDAKWAEVEDVGWADWGEWAGLVESANVKQAEVSEMDWPYFHVRFWLDEGTILVVVSNEELEFWLGLVKKRQEAERQKMIEAEKAECLREIEAEEAEETDEEWRRGHPRTVRMKRWFDIHARERGHGGSRTELWADLQAEPVER